MPQRDVNLQDDSVNHLQQLMAEGGERAFNAVPAALANVIKERQWAGRTDQEGRPFQSFEAFVTYKLWFGLESTIDDLLAYCRKRSDVQTLIRGEIGAAPEPHRPRADEKGSITTLNDQRGATYTLRRLKRDRPDLAEKVIAGELSANAAAVAAGFRKKPKPRLKVCPHCGGRL